VRINGISIGRGLVDTGATYVAISSADARHAGLRGPFLEARFATAAGIGAGQVTSAALVEAGSLQTRNVAVVVINDLPQPLLGMSFLSRFDIVSNVRGMEIRERQHTGQ
jgi:clan AA aspartic protease (TIGR02281 family)